MLSPFTELLYTYSYNIHWSQKAMQNAMEQYTGEL